MLTNFFQESHARGLRDKLTSLILYSTRIRLLPIFRNLEDINNTCLKIIEAEEAYYI